MSKPRAELATPKLLSLDEAVAWRERERTAGRRVVLTNGVFDLLHAGHIASLQQARALGDALLVCLNADVAVRALKGPERPMVGERERAFCLGALACVDAVVLFSTPRLDREIAALRPDVYAKSGDYTLEKLDPGERAALEACGADIRFPAFVPGYSTTSLIQKIRSGATPA
jgi:rfaE bifunctional protein nucleotidyltransferase chain/domain